MKMPTTGVAMLAVLATPAVADVKYDLRLEQAVLRIVADRIGTLRGGFSHDVKPAVVLPPSAFDEPVEVNPIVPAEPATHRPEGEVEPMFAILHDPSYVVTF